MGTETPVDNLALKLAEGKKLVYVATRLFDLSDKMASSRLEESVFLGVMDGFKELGIEPNVYPLFLPYRDLKEDELLGNDDMFFAIFQDDINRMSRLFGMIGYLNDPSKDDGVCMELGYAFAKQVPIIVLSSDIQTYLPVNKPELEFIIDPILHRMAGAIYHYPKLPASERNAVSDIREMRLFAKEYDERLKQSENVILNMARKYSREMVTSPSKVTSRFPTYNPDKSVFIDFIGNREEWACEYSQRIASQLSRLGIPTAVGRRHESEYLANSGFRSSWEVGENDIKKLLQSDIAVICAEGAETDAGAAALVGLARGLGKRIILYYSGSTRIKEGVDICSRNLMIHFSADRIVESLNEIVAAVKTYYIGLSDKHLDC